VSAGWNKRVAEIYFTGGVCAADIACVLCLKKRLRWSEIVAAYFEQPICMHEYELSRLSFRPFSNVRGGSLRTAVLQLVKTILTAYIAVTWLWFLHECHIASGSEVDDNSVTCVSQSHFCLFV